jgi:8-oxo-dGTP diphosphatase
VLFLRVTITQIAIAVVEQDGRFLVGQRPAGAPLAGLWEFPGGKVTPGETPEQAAARECLEETALTVRVGEAFPVVRYDYPHGSVELHFFRCTHVEPEHLPKEPFAWLIAAELAELPFPEANRAILDQLLA